MNKLKQNNGITLIALVITIIVMLILAAVSITMAVNGGLFNYAKQASEETKTARDEELTLGSGIVSGKTIDEWVSDGTTPVKNQYGFYYETPYSVNLSEDVKVSVVFKETGTIEFYTNNMSDKIEYWSIGFVPSNNKITINNIDCNVSAQGRTITIPGTIMAVFTDNEVTTDTNITTTFEEYHDIYYDTIYYSHTYFVDWSGLMFTDDGVSLVWDCLNIPYRLSNPNGYAVLRSDMVQNGYQVSMDGRDICQLSPYLEYTIDFLYPWVAAFNDNVEGILNGNPEDGDAVIYEKYFYTYNESDNGYIPNLRDSTQTFDASELENKIYGVDVIVP